MKRSTNKSNLTEGLCTLTPRWQSVICLKRHSTAPAEFGVGVLEAAGQDGAYSRHVDEHQGDAGQGVEDGRQLADVSLGGQIAISCQKATALPGKANRSWRI
jgi:hypothetical protein